MSNSIDFLEIPNAILAILAIVAVVRHHRQDNRRFDHVHERLDDLSTNGAEPR